MIFHETTIPGLIRIEPFFHADARGSFVKTFHEEEFKANGLESDFKESFYSESVKGVIRGMHFQLPPDEHVKLVFCTSGEVNDVILDLRKASPMFGKCQSFNLSGQNRQMLYIPKGCAHGFCTISEQATVFYFTSTIHSKLNDTGVRYDSFGYNWEIINPLLSERDLSFSLVSDFISPF